MPQMGVSVAEGTVVAWRAGVGDPVKAEETICEISTDKIDTEVPSPASGMVAEILVELEETVPVGTVLARIAVTSMEDVEAGPVEGEAVEGEAAARTRVGAASHKWCPWAAILARRPADRCRARHRPEHDRRHRPWWPRAQAGRDGGRGIRRAGRRAPPHREPLPPGPGAD
jgi:pyruvate/2-oxoglutarate dehydrogenase complex dihydrolipoamide acyltransferase (E2) component